MLKVLSSIIGIVLGSAMLQAQSSGIDILKYKTSASLTTMDYENELREIATSARVVGMGEATHGGTEFELIKAELVKTLVTKYGYRHLILEAGTPQCAALNEYICTGDGDPKRVMGIYFPWPFKTIGFYEMLNWLKAYNTGKPTQDQVKFYGMDVHATQPLKAMRFELTRYGTITGMNDTLLLWELEAVSGTEKERRTLLEKIYAKYAGRRYASRSDSIITLNIIETQICNNIGHGGSLYGYREELLFKYAQMVIDGLPKGEKIMLWGHNNHVSKKCSARKSLGNMLHEKYADNYKTIGFDFSRGSFRANCFDKKTRKYTLGIYNTEGSTAALGTLLRHLNKGILGINVAANKNNPLMEHKQFINSIGAEYNYNSAKDDKFYTEKLIVSKSFDYLFIVNEMHPNVSLSEL